MRFVHTTNGEFCRRWTNAIVSLVLPGSAHYLAGRKVAGWLWLGLWGLFTALLIFYVIHPKTKVALPDLGPLSWLPWLVPLAAAVDACRSPIRRVGLKMWAGVLLIWAAIPLLALLGLRQFAVQPFSVGGASMEPTIMGPQTTVDGRRIDGDRFLVNKLVYHLSVPERGDVVAFTPQGMLTAYPTMQNSYRLMRIVGLPGEQISIQPPYVLVNGRKLTQPPIFERMAQREAGLGGYHLPSAALAHFGALLKTPADTIKLGPDEFLLLGDNSLNSFDGRFFGPIKRAAILGKACYIYSPASRKGKIQ